MPWRDRRRRRKQAEEWRENQRRMLERRLQERDDTDPSSVEDGDDAATDVPDFGELPEFGQLAEVLGAVGDVDPSADRHEADTAPSDVEIAEGASPDSSSAAADDTTDDAGAETGRGWADPVDTTDRLAPVVRDSVLDEHSTDAPLEPRDVDVPTSPDDVGSADEVASPDEAMSAAVPADAAAFAPEPATDDDRRDELAGDDGRDEAAADDEDADGPHESWAPTSPLPAVDSVASAESDDSPSGDPWLRDAPVNVGSEDSDDGPDADEVGTGAAVAEDDSRWREETLGSRDPWARPEESMASADVADSPAVEAPAADPWARPDEPGADSATSIGAVDAPPDAWSPSDDEEGEDSEEVAGDVEPEGPTHDADQRPAGDGGSPVAATVVATPGGDLSTSDVTAVDDPWAVAGQALDEQSPDEPTADEQPVGEEIAEAADDPWARDEVGADEGPVGEEVAEDPWARDEVGADEGPVGEEVAEDPWARDEVGADEGPVGEEVAEDPWARDEVGADEGPVGEEVADDPWARDEVGADEGPVGEEVAEDPWARDEVGADEGPVGEEVADDPWARDEVGADEGPVGEEVADDPWARDEVGADEGADEPAAASPVAEADEDRAVPEEPPTDVPGAPRSDVVAPPREPQERPEVPVQLGEIDDEEYARAVRRVVSRALAEDLGDRGDVTSMATVPVGMRGRAVLVAREPGVVAGLAVVNEVIRQIDGRIHVRLFAEDGQRVEQGALVARLSGPLRTLLTAERTLLNLVCQLSGIATHTAAFVAAIEGHDCVVRDTRKTTPGLRLLEKRAVRAGGGANHRIGLHDALLVKDNHVAAAGGVAAAARAALDRAPDGVHVQVEVTSIEGAEEAIREGVEDLLLDNFAPDELRRAVEAIAGRAAVEASGGITLESAASYAAAGADRLAVGALTHSPPALDLALDVEEVLDHASGGARSRPAAVGAFAPPLRDERSPAGSGADEGATPVGGAGHDDDRDVTPAPEPGSPESFDATRRIFQETDDEIVVDRAPFDESGDDEAGPSDGDPVGEALTGDAGQVETDRDDVGGDDSEDDDDDGFDSLEFLRRWD